MKANMGVEMRMGSRTGTIMKPSSLLGAGVLVMLACGAGLIAGCSSRNPAYCDRETPCADPANTICDLTGAFGSKNSCVPAPADASPGQGDPDAATSGPCAGVDCSSLDDDCNIGVCDPATGECVANPAHEEMACGDGTTCDDAVCDDYADTCAQTTTSTQSCTDHKCQAGACVASEPYSRAGEPCDRGSQDGVQCGSLQHTACGACAQVDSGNVCSTDGTQTCNCVTPVCGGGSCSDSTSVSCQQACPFNPSGFPCAFDGQGQPRTCCNSTGSCNVSCG